ncbi:hypothetical protein E5D57_001942 [Metarhizium anisopliae]|nr:hypothetical protein E5D57_001942 [Metarhizium anisopliae]
MLDRRKKKQQQRAADTDTFNSLRLDNGANKLLAIAPDQGNGEPQCRHRSSSGIHESTRLNLVLVFGCRRCGSQGAADDPDECRRGTVKKSTQEKPFPHFPHRQCERRSRAH